ncbi:MAG: S49 family peptidase [Geminicoccaceae bacterium]
MNRLARWSKLAWTVLSRTAEAAYRLTLMLTMLTFLGLAGAVVSLFLLRPELPERMTLQISLPGGLSDMSGFSMLLGALGGTSPVALFDLVDALYSAAEDPRVTAVVAELGEGSFELAQNQAIAAAVAAVRAAGKRAYVFSDSFGELSPGYAAYHLASAFDEIWLQPAGQVAATGIALESRFYGSLLERFGVQPLFGFREEYKTAQHHLLYGSATGPQAEMMQALAADLQAQSEAEIAYGRGRPAREITELVAGAPYADREALALGLVDRLGYRDELLALAEERHGALVPVTGYLRRIDRRYSREGATAIGLVAIEGQLARGGGQGAGLLGGKLEGAASIAARIERLAGQERIRAIILRLDSPGGSPAAAETVHRAVAQAQAKGKRVIVSMAGLAGSGAYWLAAGADRVLAEPATLTGSIGVVGGKLDLGPALQAFGIGNQQSTAAPHAGMWSMARGYAPGELDRREALLDATYATFIARVAAGRGLSEAQVRELAKGRVWTGRQAKALGLVDRLGGLEAAIAEARAELGLAADAPVTLVRTGQPGLPSLPALFGSLLGSLGASLRQSIETVSLHITA